MGTRATYQIGNHTFYIHYDGYAAGAAVYFYNMIEAANVLDDSGIGRELNHGGYAEQFLRGNPSAEFTTSHEDHGDTEYHYTLEGNLLTVAELSWERDAGGYKQAKRIYTIDLDRFINGNQQLLEGCYIYRHHHKRVSPSGTGGYDLYTRKNVRDILENKKALKETWEGNGNDKGYNYNSLCEEIENLRATLTSDPLTR
jgi:multimeric flavodoxin WrbA